MKKLNMKKGFTLIEILFSLAVISLVVGLGISQMSGATAAAKKVVGKADLRTAIMAEHIAFSNGGVYTNLSDDANVAGIANLVALPNTAAGTGFCVEVQYDTGVYVSYDTETTEGIVTGKCAARS